MDRVKQTDLRDVSPAQVVVLMVDFQNAFCHPGSHTVNDKTRNEATARRANAFALRASELGASVVYSRQVYDPTALTPRQDRWDASEALCAKGTWASELYVEPVPGSATVIKNRFDIWQSRDFLDYMELRNPEALIICGFELCCCVLFAVLGADERGYRYVVPQDLISGIGTGDSTYNRAVREYLRHTHDAPESSETVLKELEAAYDSLYGT
jgi:nicotinamidase-related amidase